MNELNNKDLEWVREQLEEFALHLKPGTTKGKHRTAIFDTLELAKLVQALITEQVRLGRTSSGRGDPATPKTVELEHRGHYHWFRVFWFKDTAQLKKMARKSLADNVKLDTVAYTCTWSNKDSIEQGKVDCSGEIFLLHDSTAGIIAHEATHMALGILNREGEENLPITADNAPEVEEELGALVAFITDEILEARGADTSAHSKDTTKEDV